MQDIDHGLRFARNHLNDLMLGSRERATGMMYSSVPSFLYVLARTYGTQFLTSPQIAEILDCDRVSYVDQSPDRFARGFENDTFMYGSLWKGRDLNTGKPLDQQRVQELRDRYHLTPVIQMVESEGGVEAFDYLGVIEPNQEYPHFIHFLSDSKENLRIVRVNQFGPPVITMFTVPPEGAMDLAKQIVAEYGVSVSGCLKPLL